MFRLTALVVGAVAMQKRHHENMTESPLIQSTECISWYKSATYLDGDPAPSYKRFNRGLRRLNLWDVINDVKAVFTTSHKCWPADLGHYGPFFVRLAWHCSGTYRSTDGAGGCAGGRIRFPPEATWEDNGNLDKARALLLPIKRKYRHRLSWGDLYTLAGTIAINEMGGPLKEFCFGRIDDSDNKDSLMLNSDCDMTTHECSGASGMLVPGLIYVNPEGPKGNPDPALSALDVKKAFGRMGMTASQTVALIGGGHAFGKAHGACAEAPCGSGANQALGENTVTSGFEGPWTSKPTSWDNEYFSALVAEKWEKFKGPAGKWQWRTVDRDSKYANNRMLTADYALLVDREYGQHVKRFAANQAELDAAFADAWSTLINGDSGKHWVKRRTCITL